jgi:hypothetical protein
VIGKSQVDNGKIRTVLLNSIKAVFGVASRSHDLQVIARLEDALKTLLDQAMIINQDYRFQSLTSTLEMS